MNTRTHLLEVSPYQLRGRAGRETLGPGSNPQANCSEIAHGNEEHHRCISVDVKRVHRSAGRRAWVLPLFWPLLASCLSALYPPIF